MVGRVALDRRSDLMAAKHDMSGLSHFRNPTSLIGTTLCLGTTLNLPWTIVANMGTKPGTGLCFFNLPACLLFAMKSHKQAIDKIATTVKQYLDRHGPLGLCTDRQIACDNVSAVRIRRQMFPL